MRYRRCIWKYDDVVVWQNTVRKSTPSYECVISSRQMTVDNTAERVVTRVVRDIGTMAIIIRVLRVFRYYWRFILSLLFSFPAISKLKDSRLINHAPLIRAETTRPETPPLPIAFLWIINFVSNARCSLPLDCEYAKTYINWKLLRCSKYFRAAQRWELSYNERRGTRNVAPKNR